MQFHCVWFMDLFYSESLRGGLFDKGHNWLESNELWKRIQRYWDYISTELKLEAFAWMSPCAASCTKWIDSCCQVSHLLLSRDGELEAPAESVGRHLCLVTVTGVGVGGAFPGVSVVKKPPANPGDLGSIPDPGRPPHGREQLSPVPHWAYALQPGSCNYGVHVPQLLMPPEL